MGTALPRDLIRKWSQIARPHARPNARHGILQLLTTVMPLAGLWAAMMLAVDHAYWMTLLLSVPAAALTVRLLIIQHDCGHRSFFGSRRLNDVVGALIGIVTLTPHGYWRQAHNIHHAILPLPRALGRKCATPDIVQDPAPIEFGRDVGASPLVGVASLGHRKIRLTMIEELSGSTSIIASVVSDDDPGAH